MSGPARRDLHLNPGNRYAHRVRFVDSDGEPLPASSSWRADVLAAPGSSRVIASFVVDVTDADDGAVTLSLSAAVTAALPRSAVWELEDLELDASYLFGDVVVSAGGDPGGSDETTVRVAPAETVVVTTGTAGPAGRGVPPGGTSGQVPAKASDADFDVEWIDPPASEGSGDVSSAELAAAVAAEATLRTAADAALDARLDPIEALGSLATDAELATETAARVAADAALDARLDPIEALGPLATDAELATETAARVAADVGLDGRLDAVEATLPAKADLVAGVIPDAQIPAGIARDSEVATAVTNAIDALRNGASSAADTLRELELLLGDEQSAIAAITTSLATKANADASNIIGATWRAAMGLGTSATRDVGTAAGTVAAGNDARLSDTRTPTDLSVVTGKLADLAVTTAKLDARAATFAKIQAVNTSRLLGRVTAGAGDIEELSTAQAKTLLALAAGDVSGLGGAALLNVGAVAGTVAAGDDARLTNTRTPTDGTVTTAKIVDDAVTLAKLANIATARLLGRATAGAGDPEELTAAQTVALLTADASWTEAVQDVVGALVTAAGGTYNDPAGSIAFPSGTGKLTLLSHSTTAVGGTNTAAEFDLFSYTLPTNLAAGALIRVRLFGRYLNNSGASNTPVWKFKIGSTVITSTNWNAEGTASTDRYWTAEFVIHVTTPASSQFAELNLAVQSNASSGENWRQTGAHQVAAGRGVFTEDLTSAKTVKLTSTLGTANAGLEQYTLASTVERIDP
jgi:hypothetical protein